MKAWLFFTAFLLIYSALTFYLGWNIWVWLQSWTDIHSPLLFSAAVTLSAFGYMLGRMHRVLAFLKIIGVYWMILFQYGLLLFPAAGLIVLILGLFGFSPEHTVFWTGAAAAFTLAVIFTVGTYQAYIPVTRHYTISIPKDGGTFDRIRIGAASDMHFGTLSGIGHLKRLRTELNKLKPDLIVFPGDIIDDSPDVFQKRNMGAVMKEITAPLGVYGILGNHEYYGRKKEEIIEEMQTSGVTMLLDEHVLAGNSIYLAGRRDRTEKDRLSASEMTSGLHLDKPVILLDHQPYELDKAREAGADLMISGHTHRGQMWPNNWITQKMYENDWGYLKKGTLHSIVSSGFGFWGPPLRIGSRSEVVCIDITFTGKNA
ncbi:phosphoesterase [Alteribacter lacisalsi]|uniref:Phosphoesterase n=1 Tax=Alteribacter lacisalsi TaxID=2045244 RepID=A0A2W0H316_9BACI|nr:metallophosphoesterase [Alteribacter lacisalsi]PYZ96213.1 phosphoesterase [Alteribacter lacisalsi]